MHIQLSGIIHDNLCMSVWMWLLILLSGYVSCVKHSQDARYFSQHIPNVIGESAVGKSSLVLRFVKGQFHEFQESTIGGIFRWFSLFFYSISSSPCPQMTSHQFKCVAFYIAAAFLTQTVCLDDTTVKFEIWDTAGQENILFWNVLHFLVKKLL